MLDDGAHNDGAAGDNVYGVAIEDISNLIEYYFYAENDSAGRFLPERAAYEFYTIESNIAYNDLVINEIMAINDQTVADQDGEYDDWVEFYNNTAYKISTGGLYISDDTTNLLKWPLPNTTIKPGRYMVIWVDADTSQTGYHANFHLDGTGEQLILSYDDGSVIDAMSFSAQFPLISTGRYPNGTGNFIEMIPTYATENKNTDSPLLSSGIFIYPNPADDIVNIQTTLTTPIYLQMYSTDGRKVAWRDFQEEALMTIDISAIPSGVYTIKIESDDQVYTDKLVITH
jgi:hypothetical protein